MVVKEKEVMLSHNRLGFILILFFIFILVYFNLVLLLFFNFGLRQYKCDGHICHISHDHVTW